MSIFVSPVTQFDTETEAGFRTWVSTLSQCFLAGGLIRTARTDNGSFAYASTETTGYEATKAFDGSENFVLTGTGTTSVAVSGAGVSAANLTYAPSGTSGGATSYLSTGSTHRISFNSTTNMWSIIEQSSFHTLYSAPGNITSPYGPWVPDATYGVSPAPTVAWAGTATGENLARRWRSTAAPTSGAPQNLAFGAGSVITVASYKIYHSGIDGDIASWKLQSSNDNSTWTDQDTQTGITASGLTTYTLATPASGLFFRLLITDRRGAVAYCEVIEWHLMVGGVRVALPNGLRPTGTGEQYNYIEKYRFDDVNQAAAPIWIQVEYGRTATSSQIGIRVRVATDEAITRYKQFVMIMDNMLLPLRASYGEGRFCLHWGEGLQYPSGVIALERTKGVDGLTSTEGMVIHACQWYAVPGVSNYFVAFSAVLEYTRVNSTSMANAWNFMQPVGVTTTLDGSIIYPLAVYPFLIRQLPGMESVFLYFNNDISPLTIFTAPVYGNTRTYRALGPCYNSLGLAVIYD